MKDYEKEADELVIRLSEYDIDVHEKLKLNEPKVNGIHRAVICLEEKIKVLKEHPSADVSLFTQIRVLELEQSIEYLKGKL